MPSKAKNCQERAFSFGSKVQNSQMLNALWNNILAYHFDGWTFNFLMMHFPLWWEMKKKNFSDAKCCYLILLFLKVSNMWLLYIKKRHTHTQQKIYTLLGNKLSRYTPELHFWLIISLSSLLWAIYHYNSRFCLSSLHLKNESVFSLPLLSAPLSYQLHNFVSCQKQGRARKGE